MKEFLVLITWLLFLAVIYYNLFVIIPEAIILGVYPYVLGITLILGIGVLVLKFVENPSFEKVIYIVLGISCLFVGFSFIQVWRNAKLLNHYQENRSYYMDDLMKITRERKYEGIHLTPEQEGIATLIEANTGIPLTNYNRATIINESKKIFDEMIEAMDQAKESIHIGFFIVRDDHIGEKFKEILKKKVKEGVEVRLIYDGKGSHRLGKSFIKGLREAGVEIFAYDAIATSILKGKLNHSNHRKMVIIDGKVAFTGGINLGDEYLGRDEAIGNWEDLCIRVEGEGAHWIQKVFLADWYYVTEEKLLDEAYFQAIQVEEVLPMQVVTSGYDTHWNEISQVYFSMITAAKESVYIATPYLILSDSMLKALETAALRGVDVNIILPKKPDLFIVGWANASFFEKLLKRKVKVYQYKDGFLHAKAVLVDGETLSLGSANLNTRSLHLDYELNLMIYDETLGREMKEEFKRYIENSVQVTLEDYKSPPISQRLKELIGRFIIPLT
ncbi:phosphatidylserine/phosphatidylglycerophosphate/ cardiolipin synthase [Clostridium aceticum]|uniref:Cardiolipin synthase n=1 Tax=Clostridium aceticum TaxID=84022 RepID=A0A0G3W8C1_9CLOT|nr:cardiolipin synthase [Clostridium aceticum]AKL94095.1 phosphatidylserine/phosphatidylglycerophosphate/ cardiolipin synthase [Clostridium aceticum]